MNLTLSFRVASAASEAGIQSGVQSVYLDSGLALATRPRMNNCGSSVDGEITCVR